MTAQAFVAQDDEALVFEAETQKEADRKARDFACSPEDVAVNMGWWPR